jgi:hypothetical protein
VAAVIGANDAGVLPAKHDHLRAIDGEPGVHSILEQFVQRTGALHENTRTLVGDHHRAGALAARHQPGLG